jgi:predicted transcriptional regulator
MEITSILAYESIIESLGKRQIEVLKVLKQIEPANNRIIAQSMRKPINTITPRVNELRKKGLIKAEPQFLFDEVTKRNTIAWRTNLK